MEVQVAQRLPTSAEVEAAIIAAPAHPSNLIPGSRLLFPGDLLPRTVRKNRVKQQKVSFKGSADDVTWDELVRNRVDCPAVCGEKPDPQVWLKTLPVLPCQATDSRRIKVKRSHDDIVQQIFNDGVQNVIADQGFFCKDVRIEEIGALEKTSELGSCKPFSLPAVDKQLFNC